MKKVVSLILVVMLLTSLASTFAADLANWTNLPGYKVSGTVTPGTVTDKSSALEVKVKGYWTGDGNYGGIASNKMFAVDGLKIEFSIDTAATTGDTWFSVALMSEPKLFDQLKVGKPKGYFILMKTDKSMVGYVDDSTQLFNSYGVDKSTKDYIGSHTFEVKKNGSTYDVYVDDVKLSTGVPASTFTDGNANLVFSASDIKLSEITFTVKTINGTPAVTAVGTATAATSSASTSSKASSTAKSSGGCGNKAE